MSNDLKQLQSQHFLILGTAEEFYIFLNVNKCKVTAAYNGL